MMYPYWRWVDIFTPVIPKAYFDIYSQEELIKWLFRNIDGLSKYCSQIADELANSGFMTRKEVEALLQPLYNAVSDIREMVTVLSAQSADYDVQRGEFTDSANAMRDMFEDVTVHSFTIEQFNEWVDANGITAETLADIPLNVKGLAVISRSLDPANFESTLQFAPQYYQ